MDLPIIEPPDSLFYQCHTRKRGPLNFNPTSDGRFNAPNREYGITYLSTSPEGAFVEKLLQSTVRTAYGGASVTQVRLDACCLCPISYKPRGDAPLLQLVDLTGNGASLIGATGELCALTDIARVGLAQQWALRLYRHPNSPDGIFYYRARHDQSRVSIALFDRADGVLTAGCTSNVLEDKPRLREILRHYRVGILKKEPLQQSRR